MPLPPGASLEFAHATPSGRHSKGIALRCLRTVRRTVGRRRERAGTGQSVGGPLLLALHPVHAFALAREGAEARALWAHAGRQEAAHTVPLPAGEVLDLAYRGSFRPAEQGIHLGGFRALAKWHFAPLSFRLCFCRPLRA